MNPCSIKILLHPGRRCLCFILTGFFYFFFKSLFENICVDVFPHPYTFVLLLLFLFTAHFLFIVYFVHPKTCHGTEYYGFVNFFATSKRRIVTAHVYYIPVDLESLSDSIYIWLSISSSARRCFLVIECIPQILGEFCEIFHRVMALSKDSSYWK